VITIPSAEEESSDSFVCGSAFLAHLRLSGHVDTVTEAVEACRVSEWIMHTDLSIESIEFHLQPISQLLEIRTNWCVSAHTSIVLGDVRDGVVNPGLEILRAESLGFRCKPKATGRLAVIPRVPSVQRPERQIIRGGFGSALAHGAHLDTIPDGRGHKLPAHGPAHVDAQHGQSSGLATTL
jgi:hypothetical protein